MLAYGGESARQTHRASGTSEAPSHSIKGWARVLEFRNQSERTVPAEVLPEPDASTRDEFLAPTHASISRDTRTRVRVDGTYDGGPGRPLFGRGRECRDLDRLLENLLAGQSGALVVRGESGVGKSALLEYLVQTAGSGCRIARAAGLESEMELAYAGLHQLCGPMLDLRERLPAPQRAALATAFGLSAEPAPGRTIVGLAVRGVLLEAAAEQPLLCVVDDVQWLDRVSVQLLAFAVRRLRAERIAVVLALREPSDEAALTGLPELTVRGLSDRDAGALLDRMVNRPVDPRVRDRIIAETNGNPRALLELPGAMTTADLADGFEPVHPPAVSCIEQSFVRDLDALPADARRLLLTAAAEPLGDAALLWRAAGRLGLGADLAATAESTGLIKFGPRVRFRHQLMRSAAYRSASPVERREVHAALAEATDPDLDPDRRAWHRAQATALQDESVAAELERWAGRARARGGLVTAAAFLEQAVVLSPVPTRRAERSLAAARVKREAGALDAALALVTAVEAGPSDALRSAEVEHLRGQIAQDQQRSTDAARLLLNTARRLEPLNADMARKTYLEALAAAIWASGPDDQNLLMAAAEAAAAASPARETPPAIDAVLDALATRFTEGYAAAAPLMTRALEAVRSLNVGAEDIGELLSIVGNHAAGIIATEVCDFESGRALAERQVQLARDAGALVQLQFALNVLASSALLAGELTTAAALIEEDRLIAETTGSPPVAHSAMMLAAFRGQQKLASELIAAARDEALSRGQGRNITVADYASAVLYNGLGRHDAACDAARRVFELDAIGYQTLAAAELAEAASRTGNEPLVAAALARLSERRQATSTEWALGIETRVRALLADGDVADGYYRESVERLGHSGLRVELARGHLLFGEWLRRKGRRIDARAQLRTAHDMLTAMGLDAFAERARRELLATGATVRKRAVDTVEQLTVQESQIARLARDGLTNPEIGTRLFISSRTVEWHLRKIFTKLGISSRKQLQVSLIENGQPLVFP